MIDLKNGSTQSISRAELTHKTENEKVLSPAATAERRGYGEKPDPTIILTWRICSFFSKNIHTMSELVDIITPSGEGKDMTSLYS